MPTSANIDSDKHGQVHPHPPNHPLLPLHLVLPGAGYSSFFCLILHSKCRDRGGVQFVPAFLHSPYAVVSLSYQTSPPPPRCRAQLNQPTCVCFTTFVELASPCVSQSCSPLDAAAANLIWLAVCS